MKSFLAGLGIGLGLGMLFAPMSGAETRNNLRDRANDLADQARDAFEQGRDRVRSGIQSIRGVSDRYAETGSETVATGTEGNV